MYVHSLINLLTSIHASVPTTCLIEPHPGIFKDVPTSRGSLTPLKLLAKKTNTKGVYGDVGGKTACKEAQAMPRDWQPLQAGKRSSVFWWESCLELGPLPGAQ